MRDLHHLQILHDEEVESKLLRFIPQTESWLLEPFLDLGIT